MRCRFRDDVTKEVLLEGTSRLGAGRAGTRGAAAAELAVATPVVLVLALCLLGVALSGIAGVRSAALAGTVARAAARGEPTAEIDRLAARAGVANGVRVEVAEGWACATVMAPVAGAAALRLPGVEATICAPLSAAPFSETP